MKNMTEEKGTVCGVVTFFMLMHLLHVDGHDGMTHVYGFIQLVAAALQWDRTS
mgnify:CR=1 FL=1